MKLPKWFPFALLASGLVAVASGLKSGKLEPSIEPPPVPLRPPKKGTVGDIIVNQVSTVDGYDGKRWFFWYSDYQGTVKGIGPFQLTDYEAFQLEARTKANNLGVYLYRFVWPGFGNWLYDTRNSPGLLASNPIAPGIA